MPDTAPIVTRTSDTAAALLINELDSAVLRTEELGAHPALTDAVTYLSEARKALEDWRAFEHAQRLKARHETEMP